MINNCQNLKEEFEVFVENRERFEQEMKRAIDTRDFTVTKELSGQLSFEMLMFTETHYEFFIFREFKEQVQNLLDKKFPEAAGLSKEDFLKHIMPLKKKLWKVKETLAQPNVFMMWPNEIDYEEKTTFAPFLIVIKDELVPLDKQAELLGIDTDLDPKKFELDENLSKGSAYLATSIKNGNETKSTSPASADILLEKDNRSPMTVYEGLAMMTHYPEFIDDMPYIAFSKSLYSSGWGHNSIPLLTSPGTFLWASDVPDAESQDKEFEMFFPSCLEKRIGIED